MEKEKEKEKEIDESETQNLTLPDDIIFEQILPKLPVKPSIRFKSVSKSWLSTISNPQFAKSHYKQFTPQSTQFLIFSGNQAPPPLFTSVTFDQHGRVEETAKFNYTFNGGPIHVVGCCNGLVCFLDRNHNFYICNPVTQKSSEIINCPEIPKGHVVVITAGFGYISSINDYKIVCLMGLSDGHVVEDIDLYRVYIFSLKSRKWVRLSIAKVDGVAIVPADAPVLINDTMYWPAVNASLIIGVNLVKFEISTVPIKWTDMMDSYKRCGGSERLKLYGIKGQLLWCCCRDVWGLNSDGLTWMKLYELNCQGMKLLCVSDAGKWLVLNRGEVGLLDPSKPFDSQYEGGTSVGCSVFSAWDYEMSLVSPVLEYEEATL